MADEYDSHIPMPLDAAGDGPEMDESKVTNTICWLCLETWPCPEATRESVREIVLEYRKDHE